MSVYERRQLDGILDQALDLCRDAERAEIRLSVSAEALSRFAGNGIQQNLSQQDVALSVTVVEKKFPVSIGVPTMTAPSISSVRPAITSYVPLP